MIWLYLGISSGLILGFYDLLKKQSVRENAVLPVLLFSNMASMLVWVPLLILSQWKREWLPHQGLWVNPLTFTEHLMLMTKSTIVGCSWLFGYFALKHLPISIAGTIRSTSPLFTLLGAILIYQEAPSGQQWWGMGITLIFFIALSFVGKREGIHFENNRWVWLIILSTLLGACSGLWDKFLLGSYGLSPAAVQSWFSVYLFIFMLFPAFGWYRGWWTRSKFQWRNSIPLIGITLLVADFFYFKALSDPDAMVSVVSCLRRGAVIVTFFIGTFWFREKQFWKKLPCVLGILSGILLILLD